MMPSSTHLNGQRPEKQQMHNLPIEFLQASASEPSCRTIKRSKNGFALLDETLYNYPESAQLSESLMNHSLQYVICSYL